MKKYLLQRQFQRSLQSNIQSQLQSFSRLFKGLSLALLLSLISPLSAHAATTDLATAPLVSGTTTQVLPNLMFTIDDSGSMGWNYLPDWVKDSGQCKETNGNYTGNCVGEPPFNSAQYNGIYYNPAIKYTPPVNGDGTSWISQDGTSATGHGGLNWSAVKDDAYGIQTAATTNLLTAYPDVEWCTSSAYTDCLRNDNYLLPGTVNGKTYTNAHTGVKATGSGYAATGTPLAAVADVSPATKRDWGPHYYTINPGEYCDSPSLTNCQLTATATFSYPATLRWCTSDAIARSAQPAAGTCRATTKSGFGYARFPTKIHKPATAYQPATTYQAAVTAVTGVKASASFTYNFSGSINPAGVSVKVNGNEIMTATTPMSLSTSSQLATWVAGNASLTGYTVTASGSTVTITANATGTAGNITSLVATSNTPIKVSYTTNPSFTAGANPVTAVTGVKAVGTITFTSGSTSLAAFTITVNGTNILTASNPGTLTSSALATWVKNNASLAGYTITASGNVVTITANATGTASNISSIVLSNASGTLPSSTTNTTSGVTAVTGVTGVAGVQAVGTITFSSGSTASLTGFKIKVNGLTMLPASTPGTLTSSALATWVKNNSSLTGYTITASGSVVTITANATGTAGNISSIVLSKTGGTVPSNTPILVATAGVDAVTAVTAVTGVKAVGTITFTSGSTSLAAFTITVNGTNILTASTPGTLTSSALATWVKNNSSLAGYTITASGSVVTITANATGTAGNISSIVLSNASGTLPSNNTTATSGVDAVAASSGTKAQGTLTFTNTVQLNPVGVSVKVNGSGAMSATTPNAIYNQWSMGSWLASKFSDTNYTAVYSNLTGFPVVTFTAKTAGVAGNITSIVYDEASPTAATTTAPTYVAGVNAVTGSPEVLAHDAVPASPEDYPGAFVRTDIVPSRSSYPKTTTRTDCAGVVGATGCTYNEEMTNFANWWTYYHTRMQTMKTAVSLAFKTIDTRYRVGFNSISYTGAADTDFRFLSINKFDATQKAAWYTKLFKAKPSSYTPLRGALSKTGQIFAGKLAGAADPMQYSCQQNFTILSTDGYWNTNDESTTSPIYGPYGLNGTTLVGNKGAGPITTTPRPMYEGPTALSNTLADVAKYYYDTDLRTSALSNCTGAPVAPATTGLDVCEDNVFVSGSDNNVKQHMTTFTLGLGAEGTINYTNDYKTATSGDFYDLKNGLNGVEWPDPIANTNEERIDDLWHAAVNGQGTYFSAGDPASLSKGLTDALSQINAKVGAGAAAATSTLNPVAGNNAAYVASYTTVKWAGNLESRPISLTTGAVSETASWCVEDVITAPCASPSSVVTQTVSGSTQTYCVTPTAGTCALPNKWGDGVTSPIIATTSCAEQIPVACTGTLKSQVAASADTRSIYTDVAGALTSFTFANLSTAQQTNITSNFTNLSQWPLLDTSQRALVTGDNFVNYLRGRSGFEISGSNLPVNQLFRSRESVLGDALESAPVFLSASPNFNYSDASYATFKATTSRTKTVFLGANDGMLHAFDANNGNERWAYVPSMVLPNMWKLADNSYANMHTNYVNGSTTISDICTTADCLAGTDWKTLLVGGLNGGGKGFFAIDVTGDTPALMWTFTPSSTDGESLGYSFGNPVITKLTPDTSYPLGRWVVLLTSGYNNTAGTTNAGKGLLYVLDATSGSVIRTLSTNVGDSTTPSGLAKIATWVDAPSTNNQAGYTYGGDLQGNLWRFNINAPQATDGTNPLLLATLKDSSGNTQPVTIRPELGVVNSSRMVFVGTGRYLGTTDLSNTGRQSLYAISDPNRDVSTQLLDARTYLQSQTLTTSGATRSTAQDAAHCLRDTDGWYVDLPDTGERQNVNGRLVLGTLVVPTTVPSAAVCSPGGYGWVNYLDYATGCAVKSDLSVASKTNAPPVGINIVYIGGVPKVSVTTASDPTPALVEGAQFGLGSSGFSSKRAIWRELIE